MNARTLYRKALRLTFDWIQDRDEHRRMCVAIRDQFDKYRGSKDGELMKRVASYLLWKYRHPEPYVCTAFLSILVINV